MSEDHFARWSNWLEVAGAELHQLAHIDDVFWQVQAIFEENSTIPERSVMLQWMGCTYTDTIVMGLRRLVDTRRDVVSLSRLLMDMARHCTALTRTHYVALHDATFQAEAHAWFTELAGADLDHVPSARVTELDKRLRAACRDVSRFASEQVAHRAYRAKVSPKFDDVRTALVEAFLVYHWCSRLLKSVVQDQLVPVIQEDWLRVFTVPWMPPECGVPEYRHLDDIVRRGRF